MAESTVSWSPLPSWTPAKVQPSQTFSPEQLEAANTVVEFFRISDEIRSDPSADLQPLRDITTGESQEIQVNRVTYFREQGQVQTGAVVVHITGAGEPVDADGVRTVDVQACADAGKTEMIDSATGKSVRKPGEWSPHLQMNATIVHTDEGWKLGDYTNDAVAWCPL